ncbi:ABC transporter ATP-binding protein [Hujiaoplasma nucleasis]|uniref:ABC transporter ATP-binding protein n=1 Tax=Hujiaoplasma nucleasis TaxID=2725268 RepID=A0A7L6N6M8_9MOLU|nr:ABC transporter ATP-binding protein [Hujiaoplasma nucleasis]QLY40907.1 ABC transporter ATP-binding protein [Hujiaoplasma nucleasis]
MIYTKDLSKYYNKKSRGIIDLSLDIKEGEIFGFIGPNGAGKSTTVRTLLNFIFPTSGQGKIMDLDIVKDSVLIRKNVGYVPSEVHYYNDMIVEDFLKYSTDYYTDDYQERLYELSDKLELDLKRKIGDLSFGNKKKVAIVLALVYQPKILIFDEPTSGLDPLIQSVFFELLKKEKERGTTIFFSSHVLSDVQKICDRVGIIKEGRLIKVETIDDILKNKAKNVRIQSDDFNLIEDEHVIDLNIVNNRYHFTFTGNISDLLKKIADYHIEDISITEPTLEEIFMHYYDMGDQS